MLMCSGLTAYAALKRLKAHAARGPLLVVGLGGVGMMGMALARTLFATAPLVADIDPSKREAALKAGAAAAFDPADPAARKAVTAKARGVHGVCDLVRSAFSLSVSNRVLSQRREVVVNRLISV